MNLARCHPFGRPCSLRPRRAVGGALLDWIYGVDEEKARSDELDAKLKALNDALAEKGRITAAQRDAMNARLDANGSATFTAEVEAGFYEGFEAGYRDMVDGVASVADAGKDAIKQALDAPANMFKAALQTANATVKTIQLLQIGALIIGGYLIYRALKTDTGKAAAKALILKKL